jgi:NFU1 iron-sulfur cluster scaffold homolog, mitochondrial
MHIRTEETPNPSTLKFFPDQPVLDHGSMDFPTRASAAPSPLASCLFEVEGVVAVFLSERFLTVTKHHERNWQELRAPILAALMDFYLSGQSVIRTGTGAPRHDVGAAIDYDDETQDIVNEIKELIETRVRPAVAQDGGDIVFHQFDKASGRVLLTLHGACSGCPSSTATLKQGIENLLKTYVPEVTSVEAVV